MERITGSHIEQLNRHGFVLVPNFLTGDELTSCRKDVSKYFPSHRELLDAPRKYAGLQRVGNFPFSSLALNLTAVHNEIISFLERFYGFGELRLSQSQVQVKYGRKSKLSADQQLHNDAFGKHCLVYPRDEGIYRQIRMILYYSDVSDTLGPTCVVSRQHTKDISPLSESRSHFRSYEEYPELYKLEEPVLAEAGSLLIFGGRTYHRGTAIREDVGERYVQFIAYHAAAVTWMENQNWPGSPPGINSIHMERFMENATPRQREMLGFPAPGDPYWDDEMVRGVSMRYPKMDMSPYSEAPASVMATDWDG
jgi:hypothetical protein